MALITAAPVIGLVVPDHRIGPGDVTWTAPNLSNCTNFPETNFEWEQYADDDNIPAPDGSEGAQPVASGNPTAAAALSLATAQVGTPDQGATYLATVGSTEYGSTPPYIPMGAWPVIGDPSYTATGYQNSRGVVTPNGTHIQVMERTVGTDGVVVYRRAESASVFSLAATLWTTTTNFSANVHACPIVLCIPSTNDEGFLLVVFSMEVTSTNTLTARVDFSADDGVTWVFSHYADSFKFDVSSIYYELHDVIFDQKTSEYVAIVRKLDGVTYTLRTYISRDQNVWTYATLADRTDKRIARLAADTDGNQYLVDIDGSNVLASAFRKSGTTTWTVTDASVTAEAMSTAHLGLVRLPNNTLYVYTRLNATSSQVGVIASADGGYTWGGMVNADQSPAYPPSNGIALDILTDDSGGLSEGLNLNAAYYGSGSVWLTGHMTAGGAALYSVAEMQLGDYSNVQLRTGYASLMPQAYYPGTTTSFPSTKGWTYTGASVESVTTDSGGRTVYQISNAAATGYNTYPDYGLGIPAEGFPGIHAWIGPDSSGGSTSTQAFVVQASDDDGVNFVKVEVRIDADNHQIRFYDVNGAANLSAAVSYTTTAPLEILVVPDVTTLKASARWKLTTDTAWTELAVGQTVVSAVGTTGTAVVGKLTATTAKPQILWMVRRADDNLPLATQAETGILPFGIPAYTTPDRFRPSDVWLRWAGSPLVSHCVWAVKCGTGASRTSIARLFPTVQQGMSPSLQYKGAAGSAAATYRVTLDMRVNYQSRYTGMVGLVLMNAPGVASMRFLRWTGAAQSAVFSSTNAWTPFGTVGNVGFARASAASYLFIPNAVNGTPPFMEEDSLKGWWVYFAAGGSGLAGTILRNSEGRFTNGASDIGMSIELDPDTVTMVAGTFAGFSTATTTGDLRLYPPDVVAFGRMPSEATQYLHLELTLAPGATIPKAGQFWHGPGYFLADAPRAGASLRLIAPGELTQLAGSGFTVARQTQRREGRAFEFNFENVVCYGDAIYGTGGSSSGMNVMTADGSTPITYAASSIRTLASVWRMSAGKFPVAMVMGAITADPGTTTQTFRGGETLVGWLQPSLGVTVNSGHLRPTASSINYNRHGAALAIVEAV